MFTANDFLLAQKITHLDTCFVSCEGTTKENAVCRLVMVAALIQCELAALVVSELIGVHVGFVCLKRKAFKCDLFRNDGFFCAPFLRELLCCGTSVSRALDMQCA